MAIQNMAGADPLTVLKYKTELARTNLRKLRESRLAEIAENAEAARSDDEDGGYFLSATEI